MDQHGQERADRARRVAGVVLLRGGVAGASVAIAVAAVAAVLVPLDLWRPWVALPVIVVAAVAGLRLVAAVPAAPVPVWTALASVGLALGHGVWAALTAAEHVVLRRDAGSYAWYTHWIATRGGLPVDAHLSAFGGAPALADPAFRLSSPAFYSVTTDTTAHLVPQFLLGAPAWFSLGWWTAGWHGVLVMPAVAGALALLCLAGLAARLVGPYWAVLATLVLGISQPVIHAARSTYSEPLAMLIVLAGASLLIDAVRLDAGRPGGVRDQDPALAERRVRGLALAAGAFIGLTVLVRIDGLREVAFALPVAAVLALRGSPAARPLAVGALGGALLAMVPALLLSRPYLGDIAGSLIPLAGGLVVLGGASAAAVWWARRRKRRQLIPAPRLTAALLAFVFLVLVSRPLWLVVRQDPNDSGSRNVAGMQLRQGLEVDGGRTYAESSVTWMSWYLGWIAVVLAGVVLVVLAGRFASWWRSGERAVPAWLGPAVIGVGSALLSLSRPSITPDHPWADRRFVPVVLPLLVIAAVAGVAWAARRVPARAAVSVVVVGAAALVVPTWWATAPLATARTEQGELAAVRQVCAALRPGDVVIAVDSGSANMWPQVIRDQCDVPAASVRGDPDVVGKAVGPIAARAAAAGSRPVLMAADTDVLIAMQGLVPEKVLDLRTTEDAHALVSRPDDVDPLDLELWLAPWTGSPRG